MTTHESCFVFTPTLNGPVLRIGILRTSSIGDVVLATACIDALLKLPVRLELFWLGRNPSMQLVKESYPQIEVIELADSNASIDSIFERLKTLHVILDLQRNMRSRFFCQRLSRWGVKVFGMPKMQMKRHRLIASALLRGRTRPLPAEMQTVDRYQFEIMLETLEKALMSVLPLDLLDHLKATPPRPKLRFSQFIELSSRAWSQELSFGSWLGLAPGAAHETKRAQSELFQTILELTSDARPELNLVILGDESDRRFSMGVLDHLRWKGNVLNLAGKLNLVESAFAVSKCKALLSNDSSLAHIAEALNVPVSVLFGPTLERFGFAPHLPLSRSFSSSIGCRPCSKHGKTPCRFEDQLCFLNIEPQVVSEQLLAQVGSRFENSSENLIGTLSPEADKHHPIHSQF